MRMISGSEQNLQVETDWLTRLRRCIGPDARVGQVSASGRVSLTFPVGERTDVVYVEKHRYVLTRRGHDVVDIDPPGRYCPLYQRRHYRDGEPRLRPVTRFVSSEHVDW